MKTFKFFFPLFLLIGFGLSSCGKKDCELKSKYIYEPIVIDETCNCIVSGKVKYIKDSGTAVLVDYGNGTCDNIATKTICKNGKCELDAGAYEVEFEIDCQEAIVEGPISDDEASNLGI